MGNDGGVRSRFRSRSNGASRIASAAEAAADILFNTYARWVKGSSADDTSKSYARISEPLEKRLLFDATVTFNEIMYHPAGDETQLEWVELHNQQSVPMDLSGWSIQNGIQYTFPAGSVLAGGQNLVVSISPSGLQAATGFAGAYGPYTGKLSNSGEELDLVDNTGRTIDSVTYGVSGDWPVAPTGSGVSLAKIDPNSASDVAANWAASAQVGGTPGATNFPGGAPSTPVLSFNEIAAGATGFIELANNANSNLGDGGFQIVDSASLSDRYVLPTTIVAPGGFVTLTPSQLGFTPVAGDNLYLESADGKSVLDAALVQDTLEGRETAGTGAWLIPNQPTPGAPNTFSLNNDVVINEIMYNHQPEEPTTASTSIVTPIQVDSSNWKYNQSGTDLGMGWSSTNFDDSTWSTGQTGFYGAAAAGNAAGSLTPVSIPGLFGTGFAANGSPLTAGATDGNYTVIPPGATSAVSAVDMNPNSNWASNNSSSRWISPIVDGTADQPAGLYVYKTTFNLTGFVPSTASLLLSFLADNQVSGVKLNGQDVGIPETTNGFSQTSGPYSVTSGFVSGVNTLEFDVLNEAFDGTNPSGFRAAVSGTAARIPDNTELNSGPSTYYFRNTFNYSGSLANTTIQLSTQVADGAIFYLNGVEIYRQNMPAGSVSYSTPASSQAGSPALGPSITLPASALRNGKNVLAVEVHEAAGDTANATMATQLTLITSTPSNPFTDSPEEWIELFNRSDETVDLSGWSVAGGITYAIPSGTTLGAGDYLVISNDVATLQSEYPAARIIGDFSGKLSNSGESIELLDAVGNSANVVDYSDSKPWPAAADGGGSSLELRDPYADTSNPQDWAASDESDKSTWNTYSYTATAEDLNGDPTQWHELDLGLLDAGEVLIDNITVVDNSTGTVDEIQNPTFSNGSSKWRFLGNESHSTVIADPDDPANQVLDLVATGPAESTGNHIETTFVNNDPIHEGDTYTITYTAKWVSGSNLLNTRLYFDQVAQTTAIAVPQDNGTPGAPNSAFQSDIGPTYTGLSQSVVAPTAGQPVTISVHADSPLGVTSASLFYSVNSGAFSSVPMSNVSGDLYSGTIPGQAASAIVQFYVQGTDSNSPDGISTYPAGGAISRALYEVAAGPAQSAATQTIQIILTPADDALLFTNTNLQSNDAIGATVIYDNSEIFYDVGTLLHSSERGRDDPTRVGFDVDFNSDQLFRGTQDSITIDRSGTPGRAQDEILVKEAIDHAGGIPGVYDDLINVVAPNSDNSGTAILEMDDYDNSYFDSLYKNGSDGNLWKYELIYYPTQTTDGNPESLKIPEGDSVVGVDLTDLGSSKEDYRYHFILESHRDEDDYAPIIAMTQAFDLSGAPLDTATQSLLDVNEWLRTFALQSLAGITDTYTAGYPHNLKFYQRPTDGKILALPWDWDQSFSASTNSPLYDIYPYNGTSAVAKMIGLPNNLHDYYGDLQDIIATTYNTSYMSQWTSAYGALVGQDYSGDLNYIGQRAAFVSSQLPAQQAFSITTPNNQTVPSQTITLTGKGWVNVDQIFVQGSTVPLSVTWSGSDTDTWTATVPLAAGLNALTLQAVNFEGQVIGTAAINVTNSTTPPSPVNNLRITEMMYDPPADSGGDSDDYEFIELQNINTTQSVDISGVSFSKGITYTFPQGTTLAPGQRVVLAETPLSFAMRYPGVTVFGQYTGKLDNSGEEVKLISATGVSIEDFTYNPTWYPQTAGVGFSMIVDDPTSTADLTAANNPLDFAAGWRASNNFDGEPGAADPGTNGHAVVINEALTHTDASSGDWIELANTTSSSIDISGWYLSDSASNLTKYQIQPGTVIAAGGYLVFSENSQFGVAGNAGVNTPFALSKTGDQIDLSSEDTSNPAAPTAGGYRESVTFGAAANGVTFGRYVTSTGQADFTAMVTATPGAANSAPVVGPIVINELNYDPSGGKSEYIELRNITGSPVPLYDPANPTNTWQLTNGVTFTFPQGAVVPAYGYVVVSAVAPATFRTQYSLPTSVQVFGPYSGNLNNSGEELTLVRPLPPDAQNNVYYPVEDDLTYAATAPWPTTPHGSGPSLERSISAAYGDDPADWIAGPTNGTPGTANGAPGVLSATYSSAGGTTLAFTFSSDVSASLTSSDLQLIDVTDPVHPITIPASAILLAWASASDTATFTINPSSYPGGTLPAGNYSATLLATGITSGITGLNLDGTNGDTPGNNYVFQFAVQTVSVSVTAPNTVYHTHPYPQPSASVQVGNTPVTDGQITYAYYSASDLIHPLAGAPAAAGNYDVVATFSGDSTYGAASSAPTPFTIQKAPLSVTPNGVNVVFAQPIPALTGTVNGLLGTDAGNITVSFVSAATQGLSPAVYPITANYTDPGNLLANYAITFAPASVTISKATPTLTLPTSASFTADGSGKSLTATLTGAAGATAPTGAVTILYYAGPTATGTPLTSLPASVGTYSAVASYVGDVNYNAVSSQPVNFQITAAAPALPSPWTDADIGAPAPVGSASYNPANSTFSINGGGTDIWGVSDQFNFVSQSLTGDGTIIARIGSETNLGPSTKAGLMIRESSAANAANAMLVVTPYEIMFQARTSDGNGPTLVGSPVVITAPVWLKLTRFGNSFSAYYSTDGQTWLQVGTAVTVKMTPAAQAGLAVSSHNASTLNHATFSNVSVTSMAPALPAPWTDADIGSPAPAGSASYNAASSTFSINGGGTDIWGASDQFNFVSQSLTGDGTIIARIGSETNLGPSTKAGLMIRESSAANAANAMLVVTPYELIFQARTSDGNGPTVVGSPVVITAPVWLKLTRIGNSFSAYYSTDGQTWLKVGTAVTVAMTPAAQAGLAVSSDNRSALNNATFSNVSVTSMAPALPAPWTDADIGSPAPAGSASYNAASSTFSINGGGTDIWGASDQFNFVSQSLTGDGTIIARIGSETNLGPSTKAGLMIRESSAANAANAMLVVTPYEIMFQARISDGNGPTLVGSPVVITAPMWLKLTRIGNSFSAYYSTDGQTWLQVGTAVTVKMTPAAQAGLAVSSDNRSALNNAMFSNVSVS